MKHEITTYSKIYFCSWSRKKYAVFAALGKEVCISVLATHMCKTVLLKSARKGVIVNNTRTIEEERKEAQEERERKKYGCCFVIEGIRMPFPFASRPIRNYIQGDVPLTKGISLFY